MGGDLLAQVTPKVVVRRGMPRRVIERRAREIILENKAPMTRGELVAAFQDRGWPVGGTDASKNMGTIMWRLRKQFRNIDGQGY